MTKTQRVRGVRPPTGPEAVPQLEVRTWLRMLGCANLVLANLRANLRDQFDVTLPTFDILAQVHRPPASRKLRNPGRLRVSSPALPSGDPKPLQPDPQRQRANGSGPYPFGGNPIRNIPAVAVPGTARSARV